MSVFIKTNVKHDTKCVAFILEFIKGTDFCQRIFKIENFTCIQFIMYEEEN